MKKEFVSYDISLKLKALGFDEPCLAFYQIEYVEVTPQLVDDSYEYKMTGFRTCKNSEIPNHYTSAPSLRSAFEWFRDTHNLFSTINIDQTMEPKFCYSIVKYNQDLDGQFDWETIVFNSDLERSYQLAEVACIEKLCDIVESEII
jgi:hypothetical protein